MDTKQKILDEALTLFSEKGYANVFVSEIAERVGIKAPSLYKHYKSKQAIFGAIIEEMHRRFLEQAKHLNIQAVCRNKNWSGWASICSCTSFMMITQGASGKC